MPIYCRITDQFLLEKISEFEIDEMIFSQVREMNLCFHEFAEEKMKKAIMKREDHSFAIAYELLKSEKDRKIYAECHEELHSPGNAIFEKIPNNFTEAPKIIEEDTRFIYGHIVKMPIKPLIERVLQVLSFSSI